MDGGAAPGVARRAADADLHRARRAERVRAAVHAGQVGPAVVALDLSDPGEHDPGDAVLATGLLVVGEVVSRDGVARRSARRGLRSRRPGATGTAAASGEEHT